MVTGLEAIRRAAHLAERGFTSNNGGAAALTVTGGTVDALIDTANLPPVGVSESLYGEYWLWRPAATAADARRFLMNGSYAPLERKLTQPGPPYGSAPSGAEAYMVLKDDPQDWEAAWRRAGERMIWELVYVEWTPVSNTRRQYAPTGAPISESRLIKKSYIRGVEQHDKAEAANELKWKDWHTGLQAWDTYEDEGSVVLDFTHGDAPGTDDRMRLVTTLPLGATALTADSDVDVDYATMAVLMAMARQKRDPTNSDDVWNEILRKHKVGKRLNALRRQLLGEYAGRTTDRNPEPVLSGPVLSRPGR